ncbi:putative secondary metabolism biosynthetic enzyme [Alternaria novae-zelandiae]|uniref:putative secondary metabolism biosynthetic enzyme n=1 Tax=Alternaria novae-zelandiae TaxID=430562 RepID=UPI0020C556A7|nr:putative secondary metabolism biosynthetic enzyme [Alternaria novae-zelandiae]KAI4696075.1 putative secondary metabolism biosynthetic enzyme [Alternaria novae-zelandiae]
MAASIEASPPAPPVPSKHAPNEAHAPSCPSCGSSINMAELQDARQRIEELEAQMERLKEKATAAVDRCADYEDQIRSLQATQNAPKLPRTQTSQSDIPNPSSRPSVDADPPRPTTANSTKASRFSFITSRFPSPANTGGMPPPPPPKDPSHAPPVDYTLLNELERERALRAKAEARIQTVDSEIEELSVQLFSQANEMVAEERRARAKLEERVETLERRDREKMGRLDRLEKAVTRVERVKALLGEKEDLKRESVSSGLLSPPARR